MEICSFEDAEAIAAAVEIVESGGVVGAHFGTVFGLIVDGSDAGVADEIMHIKGAARGHKPLGVCTRPGRLLALIDVGALHPDVRRLSEAPWFADRLAAMVAVRAPASPGAGIPDHLHSDIAGRRWVQVFDPLRMPGTSMLIEAMWSSGIEWVAATSMNESGRTEIVDLDAAAEFADRHGLPILFEAAFQHAASGSLPILELDPAGIRLARHGIIALADLEAAIGESVDAEGAIPAHFPPLVVPPGLLDGVSPEEATMKLLALLYPAG
jgi:tRNA A37 threonylcarbamoyladenosine synthetase subunit TsaC/SUA5/YrdC